MPRTAKLFHHGRSQAVLLPSEFCFEGNEVLIRRDPATGDVILSRHTESSESFFALVDKTCVPKDFLSERDDSTPQKRKL